MSQENVEIVRQALSEFDNTLVLSESFAADFIWETPGPSPFKYHGWSGFFDFFNEWVDAYDDWEQEIEDVLDCGGNRVVVLARQRGRLRGTQDWVELYYGLIYTVEDGLIRRVQVYETPEEALEAAGLRE